MDYVVSNPCLHENVYVGADGNWEVFRYCARCGIDLFLKENVVNNDHESALFRIKELRDNFEREHTALVESEIRRIGNLKEVEVTVAERDWFNRASRGDYAMYQGNR